MGNIKSKEIRSCEQVGSGVGKPPDMRPQRRHARVISGNIGDRHDLVSAWTDRVTVNGPLNVSLLLTYRLDHTLTSDWLLVLGSDRQRL